MARKPELRWIWAVILFSGAIAVAFFDWGLASEGRLGILVRKAGKYPTGAFLLLAAVLSVYWDWGGQVSAEKTDSPSQIRNPHRKMRTVLTVVFGGQFLVVFLLSLLRLSGASAEADRFLYRTVALVFGSLTLGCIVLWSMLSKGGRKGEP